MTSEPSPYNRRDFETIVNYVHHTLCNLDKEDREADRVPKWQSLEEIVEKMKGYEIPDDIWYLAEYMLKDERELIERNKKNFEVRLTQRGRELCGQRLREES